MNPSPDSMAVMDTYDTSTPKSQPDGGDYLLLSDAELLSKCEMDTYRAPGPGGQKRNKTDSAIRLRLKGMGLMVIATESRSQHVNRAKALRRMRQAIALELRRPIDPDSYDPSPMLTGCMDRGGKLKLGRKDQRYPSAVREILDVITGCQMRLSDAGRLLGITTANLSGFISKDIKLRAKVNQLRKEAGVKPLH